MSNRFASKKRAIAECDICGFQFKLKELRSLVVRGRDTNTLACIECWSPDHPQNKQGLYPVRDHRLFLTHVLISQDAIAVEIYNGDGIL